MAEEACHVFGSTTQVGLTQALALMNKIIATLAIALVTSSCAHTIDSAPLTGMPKGGAIVVREGLVAHNCKLYSSTLSFWGGPNTKRCLVVEADVRDLERLFEKEFLAPPTTLELIKVKKINGITFAHPLAFVRNHKTGKRYLISPYTVKRLVEKYGYTEG